MSTKTSHARNIEAAEQLFADRGFMGTTNRAIAERAQVPKSLIHHHFGSKEDLWDLVKQSYAEDYMKLRELLVGPDRGPQTIGREIRTYFDFLAARPRLVRILGWMMLESLGEDFARARSDVLGQAARSLERAQSAGEVLSDVEPLFAVLTFVSAIEYWLIARNTLVPRLLGRTGEKSADQWFVRSLVDILTHGVGQPRQPDGPGDDLLPRADGQPTSCEKRA